MISYKFKINIFEIFMITIDVKNSIQYKKYIFFLIRKYFFEIFMIILSYHRKKIFLKFL